MQIKICGMRDSDNIAQISALKPDWMGFIFYPASKRYVGIDFKKNALPKKETGIQPVAVFVDALESEVWDILNRYEVRTVQFHGQESPSYCSQFKESGIRVIKAFGIFPEFKWENLVLYQNVCDYFLFDTKTKGFGGSGVSFEWSQLGNYLLKVPFFLSGGIGPADAGTILSLHHPALAGIDLNSRFEKDTALKDMDLLYRFLQEIRSQS